VNEILSVKIETAKLYYCCNLKDVKILPRHTFMTVKSILQGASCKRYFTFKLQQKVLTFVPLIF